MRADVYLTTAEVDSPALADATVVVIDVARATTTIVEALAHGARGIIPTTSTEDAVRLAGSLGRDDTLLCGERKGVKIEGFDLGNSPGEFTRDVVGGKRLVMTTTNGTAAFTRAQEAGRVLACAFTNLGAVAAEVHPADLLVIVCAGRQGRFSLEDAVCAGHLLLRVRVEEGDGLEPNDAGRAVMALAEAMTPAEALADAWAATALKEIGLEGDLEICGDVDRHDVVPEMRDQALTLQGG